MGYVNILLYDSLPKDFRLWSKPDYNCIDDTKLFRTKIFDFAMGYEIQDSIVIVINTDSFSNVLFNCGQRNNCSQNCTQKYKPNCCATCSKYYKDVKCFLKRKLKGITTYEISCAILLYDNYCTNHDVEDYMNHFINNRTSLVIAEHKDSNMPMVQNIIQCAISNNVKQVVSCGNPLDWDTNYIGKNTKVLYRR